MDISDIKILNNKAEQRFEAHVNGQTAFLSYQRFPDRLVIVHTEVPQALQHKGIGGKIMAATLDYARAAHLRVIPVCPYVTSFVREHPEYHDLLSTEDRPQILAAEPHLDSAAMQRAGALKLMAFYEIARRAKLTDNSELGKLPAFQKAKELYEARAKYLWEGFHNQEAINSYFKFHLEGALSSQGKSWEEAWTELAPESLKKYPLPHGIP